MPSPYTPVGKPAYYSMFGLTQTGRYATLWIVYIIDSVTCIAGLSNQRKIIRSYSLTKSRSQLMVERLRDLQASSPDIEASAVVSVDGLTIASALPQGVEEDRVAAM